MEQTTTTRQPAQTPAVQNPHAVAIAKMRDMLSNEGVKKQFTNALGEASAPFIASIMEIYSGDSTLIQCDPKLVIQEALKAAILKLPIIKSLGFAYVVPFKKNNIPVPQMQIGYKGYIQLAMRTGQYKTINADVVFEGELQMVDKLSGQIAFQGEKKSDKVVGFFAYFELLNGFSKTLYMTTEQITEHAKRYSKSYNSPNSIWKSDFKGMALKTPLRSLLSHYGYLSVEMMNAIEKDDDTTLEEDRNETVNQKGNKKNINADDVNFEEVGNAAIEETPEPLSSLGTETKIEGPEY
jgi:recombination protein RecT